MNEQRQPALASEVGKRVEAKPKAAAPQSERRVKREIIIPPEQRNAAVQKLSLELQAVQQQRIRLEYNLSRHNCIRLSDLGRDYDSEEIRLSKAITQLQKGESPQVAVNLLEEEAIAKNYQLQTEVSEQKIKDSRRYLQTVQNLDGIRNKQVPAKFRTPVSEQAAMGFWSQVVWGAVRGESPHLFAQENPQNVAARQAEFIRVQNLLNLKSPVELVAWAKARGMNASQMNAMIEVAKLKAGKEHDARSKDANVLDVSLRQEINAVDEMIKGLGGTPLTDRAMRVPLAEERQMDSKELYTHLLKTHGSPAQVEQYVLATYQELMREGIDIQKAQNAEGAHPDQKKARAFARQMSKNSLHKMRMRELFEEYKAQNKMGNASLESRMHEYNLQQNEQNREQVLMNKLDRLSQPPAPVANPNATPVPQLRPEAQPSPKDAIKLQLDGLRELKKDGKGLSAILNLHNISQAMAESMASSGVAFPFPPQELRAGLVGRDMSPYAKKFFGDKAPPFWIEVNPIAARYTAAFPERANQILTTAEQIREAREHMQKYGLDPGLSLHVCMRPDIKAQMDPKNITPALLDQLRDTLAQYSYPNPQVNQRVSQMHFSI